MTAPDPAAAALQPGTLDLLVLKVLALGPRHGYAIAQRLRQISTEVLQVRHGSLYPALYRLERKGWIAGEWRQSENGHEARYYRLTAPGRRQLAAERGAWERQTEAIRQVLAAVE